MWVMVSEQAGKLPYWIGNLPEKTKEEHLFHNLGEWSYHFTDIRGTLNYSKRMLSFVSCPGCY